MAVKQSARQEARKKVQSAVAAKQAERLAKERRLSEAAIDVLTALAERDEVVTEKELAAGAAINRMVEEGLSLAEAGEYCDGVDAKELSRLSRLAAGQEG